MTTENSMTLNSEYSIVYKDIRVDIHTSQLILKCDFSDDKNRDYFNASQNKVITCDNNIEFEYQKVKYKASFSYADPRISGNPFNHFETILYIKDLTRTTHIDTNMKIYFFAPCKTDSNLFFRTGVTTKNNGSWKRECSHFEVSKRKWSFKTAYITDNNIVVPVDLSKTTTSDESAGYLLETEISSENDLKEAIEFATHIYHMIGFASGRILMWNSIWINNGENISLFKISNNIPTQNEPSNKSICANVAHTSLYDPIDFVTNAWNEYIENSNWWRITFVWFQNRWKSDSIETQKLIEGMLFDRICRKILITSIEQITPEQIAPEKTFNKITKDTPLQELSDKLELLKESKNSISENERDRIISYSQLLANWKSLPYYVDYVSAILEYAGLDLQKDDKEAIKLRHGFVHNGEASKEIQDVVAYDGLISKFCMSLILGMLGYDGIFRTNFDEFKVSEVLPKYSRLKLSTIKELINKVTSTSEA